MERPAPSDSSLTDRSAWNLRALATCLALAGLLLGSWLYPPTRALWDRLDRGVFYLLNGSLDGPEWWQVTWAVANNRRFDLVPAVITLVLFGFFVFGGDRRHVMRRATAGVMVALFILAVRKTAQIDLFDVHRKGPTKVLSDAMRLSTLVPGIPCKDASNDSFPGDHCLFLLMLTVYFWRFGGKAWGFPYAAMAVIFSLPRMVGGAHWLTDNVVGAGFMALVSMSLLLATPLHEWIERLLAPLVRPLLGRFERPEPAYP